MIFTFVKVFLPPGSLHRCRYRRWINKPEIDQFLCRKIIKINKYGEFFYAGLFLFLFFFVRALTSIPTPKIKLSNYTNRFLTLSLHSLSLFSSSSTLFLKILPFEQIITRVTEKNNTVPNLVTRLFRVQTFPNWKETSGLINFHLTSTTLVWLM